ncbi:MAG: S8 family peptidase [Armatimonadota bacterium]
MRRERWNWLVRGVMGAALAATGWPLVAHWWPAPLQPAGPAEVAASTGGIAVDARDNLAPAELAGLNAKYGVSFRYNSIHAQDEKLLIADNVPPERIESLVAQLRQDPLIETAEPLYHYSSPKPPTAAQRVRQEQPSRKRGGKAWTPNDPRFAEQWNMRMVGAEQAWTRTRGKGVIVAVIDTGVAFENDDTRCYQAKDFGETRFARGYDFVNDDDHPNDDHGHGTHVAGTIAESTNNGEGAAGLAFEATIMPLKVLDEFGMGTNADIADAVRFAADHGADIINMSLGGSRPDAVLHEACKYAVKKGVLIVCAAGNSMRGPVGYPAAFPECLAVSAVGPSGDLTFYSSVGKQVGIAAPGGEYRSEDERENGVLQNTVPMGIREDDGYYALQGTSMASPHVAATAALVMSMGIRDPAQVREVLARGATPKKPAHHYGVGVLDAQRSVQAAGGMARDSWLKLVFTVIAGVLGVGVGVIRHPARGLLRIPFVPLGFVLGFLIPDLFFGWMGYGSPFNIILHSALIPLYLLWEAESGKVYRFVAALALAMSIHLGWDAAMGHAPFAGVLPSHALPWLWVNTAVGLGVALVAWRRSFSAG